MHVYMGVQRMVSGIVIRTLIGRFLIVFNILVRVKNLIKNLSDALVVDILTTCGENTLIHVTRNGYRFKFRGVMPGVSLSLQLILVHALHLYFTVLLELIFLNQTKK